jgi:alkylation response protein AidB-like acyl-CoA dehydrogenase
MAEIYVACEESRSLLLLATLRLAAERRERVRAVSAAKARIGQVGRYVAHQAIQLHGAMGMCEEVAVGHYAKRLMAIDLLYGDAAFRRRRFAAAA